MGIRRRSFRTPYFAVAVLGEPAVRRGSSRARSRPRSRGSSS